MSDSNFYYDYPIGCIVAEFDILGFKNGYVTTNS